MLKCFSPSFLPRYYSTKALRGIRKKSRPFVDPKMAEDGNGKPDTSEGLCSDEEKSKDTGIAINTLLSSITKFILNTPTRRQSSAEHFIHYRLSEDRFKKATITRQDVFEKIISLLIHHRRFREATSVYRRMLKEDFCASSTTDAQMLAIGLASGVVRPEQALEGLGRIFQGGSLRKEPREGKFLEDDFIRLLGVWKALDLPPQSMVHVIRKFISCQKEGYVPSRVIVNLLVGMLVRDGSVDEAFRVIDTYNGQTDDEPEEPNVVVDEVDSNPGATQPYAALISSLPTFDPLSQKTIDRVLTEIRSNEIQIDSSLFTALISHYARKRDIQKTLSLYDALKKAREDTGIAELGPDIVVYRRLWGLTKWANRRKLVLPLSLRNRHSRSQLAPSSETPRPPIPLRLIFRDMLQYLYIDINHIGSMEKITGGRYPGPDDAQSLLNTGLRSFLTSYDYEGAIVLFETFTEQLGVHVSGRTYAVVVWELVKRIEEDLALRNIVDLRIPSRASAGGSDAVSVWADHLLGVKLPRGKVSLREQYHNDRLVELLLNRSRSPPNDPSSSDTGSLGYRRFSSPVRSRKMREAVPTVAIVHGTKAVPSGVVLSTKPLLRMLNRALTLHKFADITESYSQCNIAPSIPFLSSDTILKKTTAMIEDVRKEMIPPNGVVLLKKGKVGT
ncbi:hypothetical protein E1B28_006173 [Marasmius oreades]|uniref:Pentatricopeptide repeat-containing protein n=1 Tax=Marasmius oreades TaxID=181124 RepID=A0A9P7S4P9_9AGAR|nr:uncharacterized protein E1B28_006173 [Marasmius oreades]KAG7095424.1 hypothetical protein E1B28_006173 [Marasmius oreades]